MKRISQGLVRGKRSTYPSRNEKMEELLLWLWDTVVEPVFEKLQLPAIINPGHDSKLTRILWIGMGH